MQITFLGISAILYLKKNGMQLLLNNRTYPVIYLVDKYTMQINLLSRLYFPET